MKITPGVLQTLGTAFKTAYQSGVGLVADTSIDDIAMTVTSTTSQNEYGWLGEVPDMREWIGDRVINQFEGHGYTIKNKDWEQTVGVKRNDILDDNLGLYTTKFRAMGRATAAHPPKLAYGLLKDGFATECYDGQYFFDTDHAVLDANGDPQSKANFVDGAFAPWFLLDTAHEVMPIVFQDRQKPMFMSKDKPDDDNVFYRKEYHYGVDARYNVGFGLWQLCFASKAELTTANFAALFAMMEGQLGDYDRPLGTTPKVLLVPPVYREKGLQITNADKDENGASNVWKGTVQLKVSPWLA
ncbi:Mu-like prophage major head subunit gpT family protein [Novosphingobium naphthalenivorans]|uniref:Mu-like prophage major head subunit gpT family protein n=1 Tax=Novosphingobium naphthalenivorans TaxID=273168 RepID=UPI0008340B20|nr:Mu-like prophage major head subunit gpT family protein [Novosphingobium naphthalenivorans]